jgi:hypothetical protein
MKTDYQQTGKLYKKLEAFLENMHAGRKFKVVKSR